VNPRENSIVYLSPRSLQRSQRRGAIAPFVALCLTVLIGILAITLDGGLLLSERRHAQAVADAAALAAAADLYLGKSASTAQQSALDTAKANGYTNDGTTSTITPNSTDASGNPLHGIWIPPISGNYVGNSNYVEVVVQWNQGRNFSSLFGSGSIPVRARAVATGLSGPYSTAGILVLDPTGQGALSLSGIPKLNVNAPVVVDSNNTKAVVVSGTATLTAPTIDITGNYSLSGGATLTGTVKAGVAPTPDPLASLPVPDPTSMTVQSSSALKLVDGAAHTLSPGVYKGGISISNNTTATLQPGIYYLEGGGFQLSGSSSVTGNGVMIYNAPASNTDTISLSGTGKVTLSPPTSGTYAGITLFQERSSTVSGSITGGSNFTITGTFYFAGALLHIGGGSSAAILGSQYISYDLSLSGNSTLNVTWAGNSVARKRAIQLVE
jgi:hypothetical protein